MLNIKDEQCYLPSQIFPCGESTSASLSGFTPPQDVVTDHVQSTDFTPIDCRSRKSHFCIKLNISQLCRIAGNTYILLPNITVPCVAGNWQLSIAMNGIVSLCRSVSLVVWTGLQTQSCYWINMWLTNWTEEFHLSTFYNTLQCIGTCCATKKENINTLSLSMYVNT